MFDITPHNYKNYLKLLATISEDKEIKKQINSLLLRLKEDKQFKKNLLPTYLMSLFLK